ncbi:16841_t:CDS:2 [Acaulospora colombiana]|uniref:16841_t:CDS:1 n=1 Tax=Acaulospora colombiana TaxID=27376 RepID=A0ACA9M2Z5_9GLOM|nr:16841_t:CDS:2 [Acaulospora colombiana]
MEHIEEKPAIDITLPRIDSKAALSSDDSAREDEVKRAIELGDWDALRAISLLPGGFGRARVEAWKFLLNARPTKAVRTRKESSTLPVETEKVTSEKQATTKKSLADLEPHKDERQQNSTLIFTPENEIPKKSKDDLKAELHHVIVNVLRKRPKLAYFQGYHDIISVLLLTFDQHRQETGQQSEEEMTEDVSLAAEKLSLHRLRDSMGPGLEPLVVDPEYAGQLSGASPLPYFTLSNLLTYFSHDMPTLPLIQHVFDYLLSRPPIAIVYLATVLLLVRKDEVRQLYEAGDEGMLHALLCNLPEISDDSSTEDEPSGITPKKEEPEISLASMSQDSSHTDERTDTDVRSLSPNDLSTSQSWTAVGASTASISSESWTPAESTKAESIPSPGLSPTLPAISPVNTNKPNLDSLVDFPPLEPSSPLESSFVEEKPPLSHSVTDSIADIQVPTSERKQRLQLTQLLAEADRIFQEHPPSSIQVSQIMGPQSVIFTWSQLNRKSNTEVKSGSSLWMGTVHDVISDDMAEKMVLRPELVVRPWKDPDEEAMEREVEESKLQRQRRNQKKIQQKGHSMDLFGTGRGSVIVIGGVVVVAALGVVIAVYGRDGEWKRWIGRSPLLTKLTSAR